jgi:membrane protease YdiL (CAAX protease family)
MYRTRRLLRPYRSNLGRCSNSALLVLAWAWLSRTPWAAIGYVRPRNWFRVLAGGIVFGVAFKLEVKMLAMPLLGADPVNRTYHFLAGNRALLPAAIWAMLVAGFAEETVFRGYSPSPGKCSS